MEEGVVLRNCCHYNNSFYFTIVLSLLRVRVSSSHTHTQLLSSCFTSSLSDAYLDTASTRIGMGYRIYVFGIDGMPISTKGETFKPRSRFKSKIIFVTRNFSRKNSIQNLLFHPLGKLQTSHIYFANPYN